MKKIGIVMGSASDLPVVRKAAETLAAFGVPCEVHVYSAHRTPSEAAAFARSARDNGFGVLIAAAGMAAHLAGALAACTTLPVIGLPLTSKVMDGVDALLSTVQMPSGIPVAAVAVDGAVNAALLAVQILAVEDQSLAQKLDEHRKAGAEKTLKANAEIEAEFNHCLCYWNKLEPLTKSSSAKTNKFLCPDYDDTARDCPFFKTFEANNF